MYGDERPHDKTLKVNTRAFSTSPLQCMQRYRLLCPCLVLIQRVCVFLCPRAHVVVCVSLCARACVWFHSKPDKLKCSLL